MIIRFFLCIVGTDLFPGMDNGLMEGRLTYRQHHGGHEAGPNWPFFLDFFEREVVRIASYRK